MRFKPKEVQIEGVPYGWVIWDTVGSCIHPMDGVPQTYFLFGSEGDVRYYCAELNAKEVK